jgi:hypothetical protein
MNDAQILHRRQRLEIIAATAVVIAATIARASVLFRTSLMPGTNGAYYLIQVRSVIEKGHLAEHDMPLIFWLQAGLSLLIKALTHLDLEPAIVLASKLFDSIVPALTAVPAFLIAVRWPGSKRSVWAGIAAGALAVFSSGPLIMIGNFQKNAFGMVLALWCVCFLQQGLARRSWRSIVAAGFFLSLVGMTHIGAFGVTLVLVFLTGIVWTLLVSRKRTHALLLAVSVTLGATGLVALLMLLGDSSRIARLVSYLKDPLTLFNFSNAADSFRGRQGPLGTGSLSSVVFFGILAACAAVVLVRQRRDMPPWEKALVLPAALLALLLSSPFVNQDLLSRFSLMAFAPGVILVAFLSAHSRRPVTRVAVVGLTLAAVLASAPSAIRTDSAPSIPAASYAELASLQAQVTDPSHTLIIAQHGLEWWAAWVLHTDVAQGQAVTAADWTTYTSVLFLQQTGGQQSMSDGPGLGGSPGGFQPRAGTRPPQAMPSGMQPMQPGPSRAPAPDARENPESRLQPSDATTLFSGAWYTLTRLPTPVISPQGTNERPR